MKNYDYFKDIYKDFFNIETPKIEVKKETEINLSKDLIFSLIDRITINKNKKIYIEYKNEKTKQYKIFH